MPPDVRIVEVGPRDGLQNEAIVLEASWRVEFIRKLMDAGLRDIEAGSFVRPDRVPQMAGTEEVLASLGTPEGVRLTSLVPNARGLERARAAGARSIAVFTGATDTFTQNNIGMGMEASLQAFEGLVREALAADIEVRGYLSVCFGCPHEGAVDAQAVAKAAERLIDMGCSEVSLGDSIGVATPADVSRVLSGVLERVEVGQVALHMHDTRGTALANVVRGMEHGVSVFDASAGGLGGCPFAPGASGNLATGDLVYLLEGLGVSSGVNPEALHLATAYAEEAVGRTLPGRVYQASRPRR